VRLPHATDWSALRAPTPEDPWRVLVSGCLAGLPCGVDGTDYGMGGHPFPLFAMPTVRTRPFCPEDAGIGTPRTMPDIHGGDGRDVWAGRARVRDERGADLTAGMQRGARAMADFAATHRVDLAVLTDMSAACGTQVISLGCRYDEPRQFQRGVGVAAAALIAAGVPVVSQRDDRSIARLCAMAEPGRPIDPAARDHHERDWYRSCFGGADR
jgi:uncharacterized protein YbbK (DUF523 family)